MERRKYFCDALIWNGGLKFVWISTQNIFQFNDNALVTSLNPSSTKKVWIMKFTNYEKECFKRRCGFANKKELW